MSSDNFKKQQDTIQRYTESLGSRYAASVFVSQKARELADSYDNVILHSEAIAWLLSGDIPEGVKQYHNSDRIRSSSAEKYSEDYLCYIDDVDVRDAVKATLEHSREVKHLIYRYKRVKDPNRRARVRVISRIVWNEMCILDLEDNFIL